MFLKVKPNFILGLLISLLVIVADQLSKWMVFAVLSGKQEGVIRVTGFFDLVQVWNRGVSFGMFHNAASGPIILSVVSIVIIAILLVWLYRNNSTYITFAISFIIGGAVGNLIDRIRLGAVADFLDFYLGQYHWPAFNVADSMVCIGVFLLVFEKFFVREEKGKGKA